MRIYLAGPDVFLAEARAVGATKVRMCAQAGFVGCFPLDAPLDLAGLARADAAAAIFAACEAMMRSCDLCLANCTPFRGVSMDSGTAYEVGFMRALGKPVFGYSSAVEDYHERASRARRLGALPLLSDKLDAEIEDFEQAENLMIAVAAASSGAPIVRVREGGETALAALAAFAKALEQVKTWSSTTKA